jgi:hypothetical protein
METAHGLGAWAIGGWMWGGTDERNRSAPSIRDLNITILQTNGSTDTASARR